MNERGFIQRVAGQVAYHGDRLRRDYIPGLKEIRPTERIPPTAEKILTPEKARTFAEALITNEQRLKLYSLVAPMADGSYRFRDIAGMPEDGNRHVHDFVIKKDSSGVQFFYIDPEHAMGVSKNKNPLNFPRIGDLRPKVNVMYTMELSPEGEVARIALLRYRASAIPKDKPQLNKPGEQLLMAQSMLGQGALPEVLQGHENEVTFYLDFWQMTDEHKAVVHARSAPNAQAVEEMLEKMSTGQTLSSNNPLEGQLRRFRGIARTHFPKFLEEKKFQPLN